MVRCKMVDAHTLVRGRIVSGGPFQTYAPGDYVAVTMDELLSHDGPLLATALNPLDVYHLLHKKNIPRGYQPLEDTKIGTLVEAHDKTGLNALGKQLKVKQVLNSLVICLLLWS